MTKQLFIFSLVFFGVIPVIAYPDDGTSSQFRKDLPIHQVEISSLNKEPFLQFLSITKLSFDNQQYLKKASYILSMYNGYGYSEKDKHDSLSMGRVYSYNNSHTFYEMDQVVFHKQLLSYHNKRVYGMITKTGKKKMLYSAFGKTGKKEYPIIDSLFQNEIMLGGHFDDQNNHEPNPEDTNKMRFHVHADGTGRYGGRKNLLDRSGMPVRCYLLLNLLTNVQNQYKDEKFYSPVYNYSFYGISEDWLSFLDTLSNALTLNQIRDYSRLKEENIGIAQDNHITDIIYNYHYVSLKLNSGRLSQVLVSYAGHGSSDYAYKYAVYEYFGDTLIHIINYEIPASLASAEYFDNLDRESNPYDKIDIRKLRKMKGTMQYNEDLRFKEQRLISYKKIYKRNYHGRSKNEQCQFQYDENLGLIKDIRQSIEIDGRRRNLKKQFTLNITYK